MAELGPSIADAVVSAWRTEHHAVKEHDIGVAGSLQNVCRVSPAFEIVGALAGLPTNLARHRALAIVLRDDDFGPFQFNSRVAGIVSPGVGDRRNRHAGECQRSNP